MMKKRKESGVIPTQPLNKGRGISVGHSVSFGQCEFEVPVVNWIVTSGTQGHVGEGWSLGLHAVSQGKQPE